VGHYDLPIVAGARRHRRGDDASAWGPNAEHRRALNAELASPASRNRTWGRTRMRLKEPAPPWVFLRHECAVRCGSAIGRLLPRPYVRYDGGSAGKQNNHVERKCYLHELATKV
jgi:hypothetical protein